jgi:glycosyltransferase involved in cell wall biosynthesis
MPLVSIIMPYRDAEPYLAQAIASIQAQKVADWELLLVDDGSRDDGPELAAAAAAADPRIVLLSQPADARCGAAAARNTALRAAQGRFIAFLDADDLYETSKLESELRHFAAHPEAMMVYGPTLWWYPADEAENWVERMRAEAGRVHRPPALLERILLLQRGHVPCTCAVLIRREAIELVGGFDEGFALYEDQTLWAKLWLRFPAYVSNEPLSRYRQHAMSASARSERAGEYRRVGPHSARVAFLQWVRDHVRSNGFSRPSTERALRLAFWPFPDQREALKIWDLPILLRLALERRGRSLMARGRRRLGRLA